MKTLLKANEKNYKNENLKLSLSKQETENFLINKNK